MYEVRGDKERLMNDEKYNNMRRVIREEERDRLAGLLEFYISTLGDTTAERTVAHILKSVINTIDKSNNEHD